MHRLSRLISLLFLLLGVPLFSAGCGSPPPTPMTYPFVEVLLENLPAAVKQVQVDATFGSKTRTEVFSDNDMLQRITISLPPDGRGPLDMQVTVRDAGGCILATGKLSVAVPGNEFISVTVKLDALAQPKCPTGAMYPVTVNKVGDLFGDVTGSMPGLDCLGPCTNKSAMFLDGSIISLSATPVPQGGGQNITFDGWSGDCTGTSTCIITLSKATTVTARFTCHGWCPEQPAAELNNLNGIWGFNTSRLVAVGNAATILQFNGTAWQRVGGITGLQPNVNLMGVGGVAGQAIGFAVGDGGNIVMTQDNGGLWTKNTNGQTKNLRSVWAASGTKAFAVGDEIGPNYAWQEYDGTSWNNPALSSSGIAWNSVWGFGATQYVVVGNMGRIATVDGAAYGLPTANNSSNLHGVWGSRSSSIFIVGASSTILSFDGSTASVVTPPLLNTTLRAIHGASPVDIYVVGDNGTVIASNGSNWNLESFPVKNQLNGVYNFGNGNVYVVGNGGIIYHKRP